MKPAIPENEYKDELLPVDYMLIHYKLRLFGAILVMLKKTETDRIPTAGVSVRDGNGTLLYNKEYMEKNSFEDRIFILMHEASHLILSSLSRGVNKEHLLWNTATDVIINELLCRNFDMKIPENALSFEFLVSKKIIKQDKRFRIMDITADKLYEMIVKSIRKVTVEGSDAVFHTKEGGRIRARLIGGLHDGSDMDGRLKGRINEAIKDCEDSRWGSESGNFIRLLANIAGKQFPFDRILKKIFEKRKYDFSRRSRRLKAEKSFFPRRKNPAFKVYAAVDVSGSVSGYTEEFLGYITALPEFEEVVFFDTKIVKVIKKSDALPDSINGYGGTDLKEVFERWTDIEKNKKDIRLNFVCLTDGYLEMPKNCPETEVLVLTCGKEVPGCRNIMIKR